MTDRGRAALRLTETSMTVGPSALRWAGDTLVIDVREIGALPIVTPVRGQIRVKVPRVTGVEMPLTEDGAHVWRPFSPSARIEVALEKHGWAWTGHGYFDANFGTRALEEDFSYWTWGRFPTSKGSVCIYDAQRLDGTALTQALLFPHDGAPHGIPMPPKTRMRRSLWAVKREIRADAGAPRPRQVLNMLDAPFYNRAMVQTRLCEEDVIGTYEALDLRRFRSPLLKPMLAVRVPRRPGWRFDDPPMPG